MSDRNIYRSQLAAYLAGQLAAADAAALERALARDAVLAREAESLRPIAQALAGKSDADAAEFRLSDDRIALIRAAASKRIVDFPAPKALRVSSRRDVSLRRRLVPALAAGAAIIIGAITGFNSGRESYEGEVVSWQVATQIDTNETASAPASDVVHVYPPAYGLDHHVSWPVRRDAAIGFATAAPANYGLPGPTPAYLIRGDTFLLQ